VLALEPAQTQTTAKRQASGKRRPSKNRVSIHFLSFAPGSVQTTLRWAIKEGFVEFFLPTGIVEPPGTPVNIYLNKSFHLEYKLLHNNDINDSSLWHSRMLLGKKSYDLASLKI
jgi:hypothetical protein